MGEGFAFFRWCQFRKVEYGIAYSGHGWERYRIPARIQWREMQERFAQRTGS